MAVSWQRMANACQRDGGHATVPVYPDTGNRTKDSR